MVGFVLASKQLVLGYHGMGLIATLLSCIGLGNECVVYVCLGALRFRSLVGPVGENVCKRRSRFVGMNEYAAYFLTIGICIVANRR